MRAVYETLLAALALGATVALGAAAPASAKAAFDCGSGFTAYNGGSGVRCVKFLPASGSSAARYVWYGEGAHGSRKYRHIGVAAQSGSTNSFVGSIADISGNGESYSSFRDGSVTLTRSSSASLPTTISWGNESWTNTGSSVSSAYTSGLSGPIIECGAGFQVHASSSKLRQYKIFRNADSPTSSKVGVRCALGLTAGTVDVWYGAGEIRSRPSEGASPTPTAWGAPSVYAHLGARQGSSYGQWDVKQHGIYNNARNIGAITLASAALSDTGNGYILNASDIAAELWIPSRRRHSFRIRPYLTSDDFGNAGMTTEMNAADVRSYVEWANRVFGGSNVEFLYNRTVPSGTGGQLTTVFNTSINGGNIKLGNTAWKQANYRAERFPADISVYFVHGPTAYEQQGSGASWIDWTFVKSRPLMPEGCTEGADDVIHLAHELGHYLGLSHTFVEYQSTVDAENAFNDNGCRGDTFDADGIDTNFDPYIVDMACQNTVPYVNLYCRSTRTWATFYPPKDNVMSYWDSPNWPNDKTLSTGQMNRIENVLSTDVLRTRLE